MRKSIKILGTPKTESVGTFLQKQREELSRKRVEREKRLEYFEKSRRD
ncbi:hypothetical protein [Radiobacillus sp. PE A8.2]